MSQLPPEEAVATLADFINYCKFQLCRMSNRLMKDPIWDTYTKEEILVEYYASLFYGSKTEREKFESTLQGADESTLDWLDRQVKENQEENKKKSQEMEDHVNFNPEALGD